MPTATTLCRRFTVHGRVQGVFYRASTREQAVRLGLTGWARNQADGSVEVLACGAPASLDALEDWLHQGPPDAAVSSVTREPADDPEMSGFDIR